MTFDYSNEGKIFTDVISKIPYEVSIQTTSHLIKGMLHVRPDSRIKDQLDSEKSFVALTNVSIYDTDGNILYQSDFLAVQKEQIVWVLPKEKENKEANE